jgi:cysteine desulfurase
VVRVTGNFTSERPLHPAVKEALLAAFDQGWADPKKISQSASRAAILKNQSIENIASKLDLRPDAIEVIGEPALGHYFSICGLLRAGDHFAYSTTDKGKIRAIARSHPGNVQELTVGADGLFSTAEKLQSGTVLSLQLANGETGVIQKSAHLGASHIAVDATVSGPRLPLPEVWSTAVFDAQSWGGPAGLGILAINSASYSYPLPHIAPIKSPGSYSLPLLIAAAIALENFTPEDSAIRRNLISSLSDLDGVSVVAPSVAALPHKLSLSVTGIAGEHLVRSLAERGIDVDSGSACSPADLQPSHVLAAMGYPTSGHIRVTLHSGTTPEEIVALRQALIQLLR